MDDYISKQAAIIEMMDNDVDHAQGTDGREVVQILEDMPAADVVPVVRCKDCKHDISSQFDTAARCNLWGCLKPKRGFCDAGKRREE